MSKQHFQDEINMRDYVNVIVKRKSLILKIFFVSVLVATVISLLLPKEYEASAIIRIGSIGDPLISKSNALYRIKDQNVLNAVIKKFKLDIDLKTLKEGISVRDIGDTELVVVSVIYPDADLAVGICEAIANAFIQDGQKLYEQNVALRNAEVQESEKKIVSIEKNSAKLNEGLANNDFNADFPLIQNTIFSYERVQVDLKGSIYDFKKELTNAKAFELFESPVKPKYAIRPNKTFNVMMAAVLGLLLGIFVVFFQESLREK
jgi:capsular polysaccharide biosynthesis protein